MAYITKIKMQDGAGNDLTSTGGKLDVNASSLPLPSGAATSAKQDTGNTSLSSIDGKITACNTGSIAGTVTANAGTNLNTSALALESGGNLATIAGAVRAEDAASADGHTGIPALAVRKATPANTSGTDGDYEMIQMSAGRVWASATIDAALPAGTNAIGKLAANSGVTIGAVEIAAAQTLGTLTSITNVVHVDDNAGSLTVDAPVGTPVFVRLSDGASAISTLPVSLASVPSHAVTNAGTFAVQVDGATLTSLQLIDDTVFTDDAAFTPGTSKVLGVGLQADETSTDSVDEGDIGAPRMTLDRKQIVTNQPHAAGGLSIFRSLDLDETEEDVKTSAGCVYGMWVTNTATSTRWIKFYNATAASVTVGSTTPVITWGIPGNTSDDVSAVFAGGNGIQFDTAISVAATTGVADADTGAPAANDVIINVFYK